MAVEVWTALLTEVQGHADEDDETEPGIEVCDEVDDGDNNISNGWEDAEHYVAVGKKGIQWLHPAPIHIYNIYNPASHPGSPHLSRLLMEEVPRSMLLRTSPVLRPRCQRRDRECRWANRRTWTTRLVNCCTRIHRKDRMLLTNPEEPETRWGHEGHVISFHGTAEHTHCIIHSVSPAPPPCRNLSRT